MQVPYLDLAAAHTAMENELLQAAQRVLRHGQFILGPEVVAFEQRFAELCGTKYAVSVNSGTDALLLAFKVLGVGPGDEVITAPNSFVATASAIVLAGAQPVFVDVGANYNIDPALIERAITPRTKAIVPVHLTGRPANMAAISEIAGRHRLPVVEDAAQAVMAEFGGQRVGSFGAL
jgi:dTDP-4-amino-4,6-dideoxygalactose transaminase